MAVNVYTPNGVNVSSGGTITANGSGTVALSGGVTSIGNTINSYTTAGATIGAAITGGVTTSVAPTTAFDADMVGLYVVVDVWASGAELATITSTTAISPLGATFANSHSSGAPVQVLPELRLAVEMFGAAGDGSTNDTAPINATLAAAKLAGRGTVVFSKNYAVQDTISFNDVQYMRIEFNGNAQLTPTGTWTATKAVLDLEGFTAGTIYGAKISHALTSTSAPGAGLFFGRGATYTGGSVRVYDCHIDGEYQVGTYVNAAAEVMLVQGSTFINQTINPAVYISNDDTGLLGSLGTYPDSMTRVKLLNCNIQNYSSSANGVGAELEAVGGGGQVQEVVFDDCYFALSSVGAAYAITTSGAGSVNRLKVLHCRVEAGGGTDAGKRFLYHNASGGLSHAEWQKNTWPISSDYIVEWNAASVLRGNWDFNHNMDATAALKVGASSTVNYYNTITVQGSNMIFVNGGEFILNDITGFNASTMYGSSTGTFDNETYAGNNKLTMINSTGFIEKRGTDVTWFAQHSSGTTIAVSGQRIVEVSLGGATTVTGLTGGVDGQIVSIWPVDGNLTLQHGTSTDNMRLAGSTNYTMTAHSIITFIRYRNSHWVEVSRSAK